MADSKFLNWKERCSQGGKLMTNLVTQNDIKKIDDEIKVYLLEKANGINANGNKVKWTDNKQIALDKLLAKKNNPDELPTGAKSHLDEVFRDVFWGRKRDLQNKYLTKGLTEEESGLGLLSLIDDKFYIKNKDKFENDFIIGTPDSVGDIVIDIKCNWDLDSFDKAEMTTLYEWQIKFYLWLTNKTKGQLVYCLVNNPAHQIQEAKKTLWFKSGCPDDDNEKWVEARKQLEKNMVFDIPLFKEEYPGYDFENEILDFTIPAIYRVKKFEVELFPDDIVNIKSRVKLAREYLMEKEKRVLELININQKTQ